MAQSTFDVRELTRLGFVHYCDDWKTEPDRAASLSKFAIYSLFEGYSSLLELDDSAQVSDLISDVAILKREFDGAAKFISLGLSGDQGYWLETDVSDDPDLKSSLLQRRYSRKSIDPGERYQHWRVSAESASSSSPSEVSPLIFATYADEFIGLATKLGDVFRESENVDQQVLVQLSDFVNSAFFFGQRAEFAEYAKQCIEVLFSESALMSSDLLLLSELNGPIMVSQFRPNGEPTIQEWGEMVPWSGGLYVSPIGDTWITSKPRTQLDYDEFGVVWRHLKSEQ